MYRGVLKLSEALFRNTTLQSVNLVLNSFGPEGKDALLDVMDFSFRWWVRVVRPHPVATRACNGNTSVLRPNISVLRVGDGGLTVGQMLGTRALRAAPAPTQSREALADALVLAIAMALHPRLGAGCALHTLANIRPSAVLEVHPPSTPGASKSRVGLGCAH